MRGRWWSCDYHYLWAAPGERSYMYVATQSVSLLTRKTVGSSARDEQNKYETFQCVRELHLSKQIWYRIYSCDSSNSYDCLSFFQRRKMNKLENFLSKELLTKTPWYLQHKNPNPANPQTKKMICQNDTFTQS